MKYLKRFGEDLDSINENNLEQSVIDDCKDILLELEDNGFSTHIESDSNNSGDKSWINFNLTRRGEYDYSDIEDVVERLKSYLSECGFIVIWRGAKEKAEKKPSIDTYNHMEFEEPYDNYDVTRCELNFIRDRATNILGIPFI
jgi:hypothetical protein